MARSAEAISEEKILTEFQENFSIEQSSTSYADRRRELLLDEQSKSWDAPAKAKASNAERQAQEIIFKIRESERRDPALFGNLPSEQIPDLESRDLGGQFLVNLPRIQKSAIFAMAQAMPKGAHQHLHFNCELQPERLLPHAKAAEVLNTMCIRSTIPLCAEDDFRNTEIAFKVVPADKPKFDLFSKDYKPDRKNLDNTAWMLWSQFRKHFPSHITTEAERDGITDEEIKALDQAELWAREKMIVTRETTYKTGQTHNGSWACFNQGTRAFKGLLGYEGVYRWYISELLDNLIREKVMYAELRPMLMDKNLPKSDGKSFLNHHGQMEIIEQEIAKKKDKLKEEGNLDSQPFGIKIIYCTPRSIPRTRAEQGPFPSCMETELEDCLKLKLQFPNLICGFDLVGAEDRHNNIGHYADLLEAFQKTCAENDVTIPFLFHAGESLLDAGGNLSPDKSNLYDALLLHSKRIGHGYALLKHPELLKKYKAQGICLELCPISNELLHLCGNIRQHPYPQLLAAGLHCTISGDNPSMYRSSLSHEFYQVMVGDPRMTIHGWKQLAQWSLEHSCLSEDEIARAKSIHARDFEVFCQWVVDKYQGMAAELVSKFLPEIKE